MQASTQRSFDLTTLLASDTAIRQARQRGLLRLVQALFREGLLQRAQLITEGAISWLALWSQQRLLRFEGLQFGRTGYCNLTGSLLCFHGGEPTQPILNASMLMKCIGDSLPLQVSSENLQRVIAELDNCLDNDVLCLAYRASWSKRLAAHCSGTGGGFLAGLREHRVSNPTLLLEQWATLGHPWHPNYKTRLGLSPQALIALSPEFEAQLAIPVLAVRRHCMHLEMSDNSADYCAWFAATYADVWQQWSHALAKRGETVDGWLPLPVHPYQAEHILPTIFADEMLRGDLLVLDHVTLPATPTMSFRTVAPLGNGALPHLKLPVALRMTSVQRTLSPKSAVMGPRLTTLVRGILRHENGFGQTLDVLGEEVGLHFRDSGDDRARHLAVVFRVNPMQRYSATMLPLPVAALAVESPDSGRPLIAELVALADADHAAGALAFFERYTATVLRALLSPYLLYGIAFEAHQQNSFMLLDADWQPVRLLVRDFGDLRIHAPTLRRTGLTLDAFRPGHTLFEDDQPVRDKLLHAVMLCHLGELIPLLASTFACRQSLLWNTLRRQIENVFDQLKHRTDPQRWTSERTALLQADWPVKSFLRMRLSDASDDVHGAMANPLREPA